MSFDHTQAPTRCAPIEGLFYLQRTLRIFLLFLLNAILSRTAAGFRQGLPVTDTSFFFTPGGNFFLNTYSILFFFHSFILLFF